MKLSIYHDTTQDTTKPITCRDNFDAMVSWEELPDYIKEQVKAEKPHLADFYHRNSDEPIYVNLYFYDEVGKQYYVMNNIIAGWNRQYTFADHYCLDIPCGTTIEDNNKPILLRPQYSYYPKEGYTTIGNKTLKDGKVVLNKDACGQQSIELAVIYRKGITPDMVKTIEYTQSYFDGYLFIQQFIDLAQKYEKTTYDSDEFKLDYSNMEIKYGC